jgi:hypothetical protein
MFGLDSGLLITKEQKMEIFSGPNGQSRVVLEQFLNELKRREG